MNQSLKCVLLLGLFCAHLGLFAQTNTSDVINNAINYYAASYSQHAGNGADGDDWFIDGADDIAIKVHMETNNGLVHGTTCTYFECNVPCDPSSTHQHQASEVNRPFNTAIKAVIEGWESDATNGEVCTFHSYDDNYATGSSGYVYIAHHYPNQLDFRGAILGGSDQYDAQYLTTWRFTHGTGWQDPLNFGTLSTSGKTVKDFGSNQNIESWVLNPGAMGRPNVEGNASGDVFYSFTLGAPAPVTITTDFGGTNFDTFLELFDAAHNSIAYNDDVNSSNSKSTISQTLLPGTYIVRVEGYNSNQGRYQLQVQLGQVTSTYFNVFGNGNISLSVDAGFPVKPACSNDGVRVYGGIPGPVSIQGICDNKAGYFVVPKSNTDHYPLTFTWNTTGGSLQVFTGDITNGVDPSAGTTYTNFGSCPGSAACLSFDYVPQNLGTNTAHHYVQLMAVIRRNANGDVEWAAILPIYVTGKQGVVRGETLSPSIPTMVVHDPPGDASFASIASAGEVCHGYSIELSQDQTTDVSATVKLGVEGSVGLFVETDYSVYAQATASMEVGVNKTTNGEYQMCYKTTNTFSTSAENQSSDDLFIGSVTKFIYGFWYTLQYDNNTCDAVGTKEATFAPDPNSLGGFFFHPESEILNTIIPNLEAQIAANCADPNSPLCHENLNQLSIWHQALANNNQMKANAGIHANTLVTFSGGGSGFDNSTEITTSAQETISTSLYVETGFAVEAGAEIAGSGVSGGVGMKTKFGFGSGTSGSNATTNTITYHLQDNDAGDQFATKIYKDGAFGTPLFKMETIGNQTSCPFEGGIQLDQPHLSIVNSALNTINVTALPGNPAVFNVGLCNNSPVSRTYYLKLNASSNLSGAVVKAAGATLNGNDLGQQYTIPANGCLQNLVITIEQGASPSEEYANLEIFLYSLCEEDYTPQHSSIFATAFFGQIPANDLACNAILIPANGIAQMGYSNAHATASSNEAILTPPSTNDCINSWCENGGNQITHSVWFKFVAPSSGSVEVSTCGLTDVDTQIAAYSASDCNNFSSYTLLGANDDRIDACGNNPYDSKMNVTGLNPGQTYYVIVDGWGSSTGAFGIKITPLSASAVSAPATERILSASPNPTSGFLTLRMSGSYHLDAYMLSDMAGRTVQSVQLESPAQETRLDLSALPKGVYMLQVRDGAQVFSKKIVLQ